MCVTADVIYVFYKSVMNTSTKEKDSLGCPFLWSKTRQGCGGGYLYRRREEKHME